MTGFDITIEERRFFDHYLKGIDNGVMDEPGVYYYTYGKPKGQEWSASRTWPLPNERRVPYYLGAGSLVREAPTAEDAKDELVVNYEATAANAAMSGLVYETSALEEELLITGHPVIDMWLASTAADSDVVAYLQNVAPDGSTTSYNMHGRLRASQRKEGSPPYDNLGLPWHPFRAGDAQPLVPGEPVQLRFDMLPISMLFEKGHKLRLILTFADAATPRLDPAPSVTVLRDVKHPSTITLPVIKP
jgi:predicted acyl esterase